VPECCVNAAFVDARFVNAGADGLWGVFAWMKGKHR